MLMLLCQTLSASLILPAFANIANWQHKTHKKAFRKNNIPLQAALLHHSRVPQVRRAIMLSIHCKDLWLFLYFSFQATVYKY